MPERPHKRHANVPAFIPRLHPQQIPCRVPPITRRGSQTRPPFGGMGRGVPVDRRSGQAFNLAVRTFDTTLLDLLMSHGADSSNSRALHGVVQFITFVDNRTVAFSDRLATADCLMALDGVDVNDVKRRLSSDLIPMPGPTYVLGRIQRHFQMFVLQRTGSM